MFSPETVSFQAYLFVSSSAQFDLGFVLGLRSEFHFSLSDKEEGLGVLALENDGVRDWEVNGFGVVDHKLQLVRFQGLQQRTMPEHLQLAQVYSLPIRFDHLFKGSRPQHTDHGPFLFSKGS